MKAYRLPFLTFLACSGILFSAFIQKDLRQQLIGEWRNVYVRVRLNINDKTTQPAVMEADSTNWEARLGIKPIRTRFKEDGTYASEYHNLKDSLIRTASGTWTIKGDSLTMDQAKPDKSTLKLKLVIKGDHATFSGLIDFDGKGKLDDEYYGIQKKLAK